MTVAGWHLRRTRERISAAAALFVKGIFGTGRIADATGRNE
jgi:hypothetical protein